LPKSRPRCAGWRSWQPGGHREARLAGFTELAGTAIANAEAQAALAASRARIVAAGDEARRRIERDLHDGVQQRLVTLALRLRQLRATASPAVGELAEGLDGVATVATVEVAVGEGVLRVCVSDDGRGGADFGHGSGLVGLTDRVEALGGRIALRSPPGGGTTLEIHIPLRAG